MKGRVKAHKNSLFNNSENSKCELKTISNMPSNYNKTSNNKLD